jgi:hypothetical protein
MMHGQKNIKFFFVFYTDRTRANTRSKELRALLHKTNTGMSAWLLIEWQPAGRSELFLFGL